MTSAGLFFFLGLGLLLYFNSNLGWHKGSKVPKHDIFRDSYSTSGMRSLRKQSMPQFLGIVIMVVSRCLMFGCLNP